MNVGSGKTDGQNEESGNWHKRLRLRKNSFTSSCEQHTVKQEKKHAESLRNGQTVNRSINKRTSCCSACKDDSTFGPIHAGKAPAFPCDTSGFSTSVFSTLRHHRIMHENCSFTCEVCNDNVQQTFPQVSQHCHEENISNVEFKSEAAGEEQKRLVGPCRHRWSRRNWWRKREPGTTPDNKLSHRFKFLLPKPEAQWTSPVLPISAPGLLDNRGVLLDAEKTLQETQQFLERTISAGKKWPVFFKTELDQTKPRERRHPDLITGLMEKNNISVPPDCTTKVLGFKMVDGKKHLILKVIPSNKRDASAPRKSKGVECQTANDDGSASEHASDRDLTSSRWKQISVYNLRKEKSQQNFITSQRDSGCHGDAASGSSEERCHSRFVALVSEKEFRCSDMTETVKTDSCVSSSHLKVFCQIESEISGAVLFHGSAAGDDDDDDESTNNTNPRDVQLPVDKRKTHSNSSATAAHQLTSSAPSSASVPPSSSHHHITDAEGEELCYTLFMTSD